MILCKMVQSNFGHAAAAHDRARFPPLQKADSLPLAGLFRRARVCRQRQDEGMPSLVLA